MEQIIDEGYEWKGDTYDKFKSNGSYLKEDNNSYYNSIDDVLDAVNDKITELETEYTATRASSVSCSHGGTACVIL